MCSDMILRGSGSGNATRRYDCGKRGLVWGRYATALPSQLGLIEKLIAWVDSGSMRLAVIGNITGCTFKPIQGRDGNWFSSAIVAACRTRRAGCHSSFSTASDVACAVNGNSYASFAYGAPCRPRARASRSAFSLAHPR